MEIRNGELPCLFLMSVVECLANVLLLSWSENETEAVFLKEEPQEANSEDGEFKMVLLCADFRQK